MHIDVINAFVGAAFHVLRDTLKTEISRGALVLQPSVQSLRGVAAVAGLSGDLEGSIILDMPGDTALAVAALLSGQEMSVFDALAQAAVIEMTNLFLRRACQSLRSRQLSVECSPTVLVCGEKLQLSSADIERLTVPFDLPLGTLELHLGIRDSSPEGKY